MSNHRDKNSYIVVGNKRWNARMFQEVISKYPGRWFYIGSPKELTLNKIREVDPRYIFFLHWSWRIPDEIVKRYECVCFHMTDVPYGRGGSPLQNLIVRGRRKTKQTGLRMTANLDAGPVYLKRDLSLEGNAEEIYIRASKLSAEMIKHIITKRPKPVPQAGKPVVFKRRTPEQSEISNFETLSALHDFIRMLDAEGYPKAFIKYKGFRYEFKRAALYNGKIIADVTITLIKKK